MTKELTKWQKIRQRVYDKYNGHCAYCGSKFIHIKRMHVDHIIPVSRSGNSELENLNPACVSCNNTKSSLTLDEFRQAIAAIGERLASNYSQINFCKRLGIIHFDTRVRFYFERIKDSEKEEKK